jgi:hypothetical protein
MFLNYIFKNKIKLMNVKSGFFPYFLQKVNFLNLSKYMIHIPLPYPLVLCWEKRTAQHP